VTALTTILTDLAAPNHDDIVTAYLEAAQRPHNPECGARIDGTVDNCSCPRARLLREATARYRQSCERIAALGLRFWSSGKVEVELRR
jgi:hypothetical protein